MKMISFIYCEMRKIWRSLVFWMLLTVFIIMPLMLGFVTYLNHSNANWESYLSDVLSPLIALLIVGFSFTAAWVFGREYTDKTINDLLVKPVSKLYTVLSKFIVILMWDVLLALFTFVVVTGIGGIIGMSDVSFTVLLNNFLTFFGASLLIAVVSTIMALLAVISKGYLAPIGLTFVLVILSNVVMQMGIGPYFPWTIPVLFLENAALSLGSIVILIATGIAGFTGTVAWWRFSEQ